MKHGELRFVDNLFGKIAPASSSKCNSIRFLLSTSRNLKILAL